MFPIPNNTENEKIIAILIVTILNNIKYFSS